MTIQEYFDEGKYVFGVLGRKPEIKNLKNSQLLGFKVLRFADLSIDIPVLKAILNAVEQGNSGVDVKELTKTINPDLYQFYKDYVPDKNYIIHINNNNTYSIGCKTFTIESAIELNKLL